eukprot:g8068.t1
MCFPQGTATAEVEVEAAGVEAAQLLAPGPGRDRQLLALHPGVAPPRRAGEPRRRRGGEPRRRHGGEGPPRGTPGEGRFQAAGCAFVRRGMGAPRLFCKIVHASFRVTAMGKKIVGVYCFLCVTSFVLMSISCFNKWHQVTFKTFGGWKTAFRLETSLTKSVMPKDSRLFCGLFTKWQPKRCLDAWRHSNIDRFARDGQTSSPPTVWGRCDQREHARLSEGLADGWPLQEAAADWCAPAITAFYQHPCIAFNRAYIMGMVVLIVYAINVILLSTCAYLLYYYLDSKSHKPIYRTWAVILHGLGTFLMLCAVAGYTAFAMTSLDHIGGEGLPFVFEASQSVGMCPGYFLVWVALFLQLVSIGMHTCMKLSNEQTEEQRIYKDRPFWLFLVRWTLVVLPGAEAGAYSGYDATYATAGYDGSTGYDAAGAQYAGYPAAGSFGGAPGASVMPQPAGMPQGGSTGAPAGGAQPGPGQAAW